MCVTPAAGDKYYDQKKPCHKLYSFYLHFFPYNIVYNSLTPSSSSTLLFFLLLKHLNRPVIYCLAPLMHCPTVCKSLLDVFPLTDLHLTDP